MENPSTSSTTFEVGGNTSSSLYNKSGVIYGYDVGLVVEDPNNLNTAEEMYWKNLTSDFTVTMFKKSDFLNNLDDVYRTISRSDAIVYSPFGSNILNNITYIRRTYNSPILYLANISSELASTTGDAINTSYVNITYTDFYSTMNKSTGDFQVQSSSSTSKYAYGFVGTTITIDNTNSSRTKMGFITSGTNETDNSTAINSKIVYLGNYENWNNETTEMVLRAVNWLATESNNNNVTMRYVEHNGFCPSYGNDCVGTNVVWEWSSISDNVDTKPIRIQLNIVNHGATTVIGNATWIRYEIKDTGFHITSDSEGVFLLTDYNPSTGQYTQKHPNVPIP